MNWAFKARDLVAVPRLSAETAVGVGNGLITAGKQEKRIPSSLKKALAKVKRAQERLAKAARERVPAEEAKQEDAGNARRDENASWGALEHQLSAWATTRDDELAQDREIANRLLSAIFGDGRNLLRAKHQLAWARSEQRLELIAERDFEQAIRDLGGGAFFDSIRRMHKRYGEIIGITKSKPPLPVKEGPNVRELLREFTAVLREYVVQVSAVAETSEEAQQLAVRLLAPLAEWKEGQPKRSRRRSETDAQPAPATPVPPPVQ